MEEGWSVKKMHRLILLSNTYQQDSDEDAARKAADPENRLLASMNRRRLEFEPLRDALLAVAGQLDPRMGGKARRGDHDPAAVLAPADGVRLHRPPEPAGPVAHLRLRQPRRDGRPAAHHDHAAAGAVPDEQPVRGGAGPRVRGPARRGGPASDEERIDRMYRLAYGRPPEPEEMALGLRFLKEAAAGPAKATPPRLTPWEQYAQVLLEANEFAFVD